MKLTINEGTKRRNKSVKENFYRVWYNPYLLEPDEEDYIEVTAETADEARRRVNSKGYVTSVEEIESLTNPYDESKTMSKRNKLMEKSNFDDTDKAIRYYYPKWYYDNMSANDISNELERLGHSQDFIDAVIDGITDKYENEEDYGLDDYDECLEESNVLGMGGGYPNVYLPKEAKNYLMSKGWEEIELPDLGPCFYMRFTGNDNWEIYIDQQYGGIYVVQEGYDISPTDDIGTIDDTAYKRDIDDLITLGNCLSNGEDFNTCMNNWWGVKESIKHSKKKYVKEDLYHDAQKAVYDFFMKKNWDLNIPEVANYAEAVAEQLELDPEFADGTYTMRDWYKDTQINYPEDIEWLDSTAYWR